jgi:hypothetical protein
MFLAQVLLATGEPSAIGADASPTDSEGFRRGGEGIEWDEDDRASSSAHMSASFMSNLRAIWDKIPQCRSTSHPYKLSRRPLIRRRTTRW